MKFKSYYRRGLPLPTVGETKEMLDRKTGKVRFIGEIIHVDKRKREAQMNIIHLDKHGRIIR